MSQNLTGTLAALKELKSEYYVGSSVAFEYLKAMRRYEATWGRLKEGYPELVTFHELTVRKLAWLLHAIYVCVEMEWRILAILASSPTCITLECSSAIHGFVSSYEDNDEHETDPPRFLWKVDYDTLLVSFLGYLQGIDARLGWEDIVDILRTWVSQCLKVGFIEPELVPGDEELVVPGDKARTMNEADFWACVNMTVDCGVAEDADPAYIAEFERLAAARDARSLSRAHESMKAMDYSLVSNIMYSIVVDDLKNDAQRGVIPIDEMLHSDSLYERATNEYTLGTFEVERRVALNAIFRHRRRVEDSLTAVTRVLGECKVGRDNSKASIRTLETMHAPANVLASVTARVKRWEYLYLAIHNNKNWLIEFLSR